MTRLFYLLFLALTLSNCAERFESVDPSEFNQKVKYNPDIKTARSLIELFYDYPKNEEPATFIVEEKTTDKGDIEITLIHDNQPDDSQKAIKIIMLAELSHKTWTVKSIKKNRKCWPDRGHTNWGTERCD